MGRKGQHGRNPRAIFEELARLRPLISHDSSAPEGSRKYTRRLGRLWALYDALWRGGTNPDGNCPER